MFNCEDLKDTGKQIDAVKKITYKSSLKILLGLENTCIYVIFDIKFEATVLYTLKLT
jgi:hypothetical protein